MHDDIGPCQQLIHALIFFTGGLICGLLLVSKLARFSEFETNVLVGVVLGFEVCILIAYFTGEALVSFVGGRLRDGS